MTQRKALPPLVYFIRETEQIVGRHRVTLRRWWDAGIFPKPTLINNRLAWQAKVIEQWINHNVQGAQIHEEHTDK